MLIETEDQAVELLRELSSGKRRISQEELDGVEFGPWVNFNMHLEGLKYHQSITPSVMKGMLDVQHEIYKAYTIARYNHLDSKTLTKEEREQMEMVVSVRDGSSNYDLNIQELATKLIEMVGDKMEPEHVLIGVISFGLLYFGKSAFTHYLDHRANIRGAELDQKEKHELVESLKFSSEQETERMKIMKSLIKSDHRIANMANSAHDVHTAIVKASTAGDEAEIQGIALDREVATILTQNARRKSEEARLDGLYTIKKVDASKPGEFKVTVEHTTNGTVFDAVVQESALGESEKAAIQAAEWDRSAVSLKINAKQKNDVIHSATIINISKPKPKAAT